MLPSHPNQTTATKRQQESIWDYPLHPHAEASSRHIEVSFNDLLIADSRKTIRVVQRGLAPVFYVPRQDVQEGVLDASKHRSFCSLKGQAEYYHIRVRDRLTRNAAWSYRRPPDDNTPAHYLAFYAHLLDRCSVDGEPASAPDWNWVGGWVTSDIAGPFMTQKEAETLWHPS